MFESIRRFIEQRRFRKDLTNMRALIRLFVESIHDIARKHECENALNGLEVHVLGTFVVSEIYLGLSRDNATAVKVLNDFHTSAVVSLLNNNLSSLQKKWTDDDTGAMYDQFASAFQDKTKQRYPEFRDILLDEKGQFYPFSMSDFPDIGSHLLNHSSNVNSESEEVLTFLFFAAVVDHMSRCNKALKH